MAFAKLQLFTKSLQFAVQRKTNANVKGSPMLAILQTVRETEDSGIYSNWTRHHGNTFTAPPWLTKLTDTSLHTKFPVYNQYVVIIM